MAGELMLINPRKRRKSPTRRRKSTTKRRTTRARRNPVANPARRRVKRRTYRRNPTVSRKGIVNDLMNAGIGAVGAVGVDFVYNMLPLPATLKIGMMNTVGRAAAAIALGTMGKPLLGKAAGQMAAGSLTVIAHELVLQTVAGTLMAPKAGTVKGLDYYAPAQQIDMDGMGEYDLGEYDAGADDMDGLDAYSGCGRRPRRVHNVTSRFRRVHDVMNGLDGMGEYANEPEFF